MICIKPPICGVWGVGFEMFCGVRRIKLFDFTMEVFSFYHFTFVFCLLPFVFQPCFGLIFAFKFSDKSLFPVVVVIRLTGKVVTTKTLKHEEEK